MTQNPPDKATLETKRPATLEHLIQLLETPYAEPGGMGIFDRGLRTVRYLHYKLNVLYLLVGFSDCPDLPLPETGLGSVQNIMAACAQLENRIAQTPADLPHVVDSLAKCLIRRYFATDVFQQIALEAQIANFNTRDDQFPAEWYRLVKDVLVTRHSPLAEFMKDYVQEPPGNP